MRTEQEVREEGIMELENTIDKVKQYLNDNPGALDFLERILDWEDREVERTKDLGLSMFLGWEQKEVAIPKAELEPMLYSGVIELRYRSSKYTNYALVDREATRVALEKFKSEIEEAGEEVIIPGDFLDIVELRENEKALIISSLKAPKPVHILMVGPPASAKSLILQEVHRAFPRRSRYSTGGTVSKMGLVDFLIVHRPRILLLDEIDFLASHDQPALLSLMEDGVVTRLKYGKRDTAYLTTWVLGGCNSAEGLIEALRSRFFPMYLEPYTQDEFRRVSEAVLVRREGVPEDIAGYIADRLSPFTKDMRDPVKLGRLASSIGYDQRQLGIFIQMMQKGHRVS